MMRRRLATAAALVVGLVAMDTQAAPPALTGPPGAPAIAHPMSIEASPVFGADGASGSGWNEVVARLENTGTTLEKGTLDLTYPPAGFGRHTTAWLGTQSPFRVAGRSVAVFHLPMFPAAYGSTVTVTARGDDGTTLAEATVSLSMSPAPLLVDVDEPSRLAVVMRGWPMAPSWTPGRGSMGAAATALTVGTVGFDPTTGDPELPLHAAGYAAVTAVVMPSDRLARLQSPALGALVGWLLSGGTLAVFPTRPEDLRAGTLTKLTGGPIAPAPPPPVLMTLPSVTRAPGAVPPGILAPPNPMLAPEPTDDAGPGTPTPLSPLTPIGWFVPVRTTPLVSTTGVGPGAPLRGKVSGYTGGNLRASPFGATAPYGLGQVHVLAFDPTTSPALEDGWAHGRVLDLLADAWDRRALVVFPEGSGNEGAVNAYKVHQALDPNENFRPALGIAAILLVLYAVAVGPWNFLRARKRGRPLDPLVWAPIASATCFAALVLVGLAGKGWSGRARRLSLVEAGAGMSRGAVRRFRGFFSSQTRNLHVRASDPGDVLDVMATDARDPGDPVLRVDKDGASLENLTSLPWQTVVVSEDGFDDLGDGIAVHRKSDGSLTIANHTGKLLRNVVAWAPDADASFFASIAAGETVVSTGGHTLFVPTDRIGKVAGLRTVHGLDPSRMRKILGPGVGEELAAQWSALEDSAGPFVDWWPDDVPVVIGEISGGDGPKVDSGLRVDMDSLLFRVVGEGGAT